MCQNTMYTIMSPSVTTTIVYIVGEFTAILESSRRRNTVVVRVVSKEMIEKDSGDDLNGLLVVIGVQVRHPLTTFRRIYVGSNIY